LLIAISCAHDIMPMLKVLTSCDAYSPNDIVMCVFAAKWVVKKLHSQSKEGIYFSG